MANEESPWVAKSKMSSKRSLASYIEQHRDLAEQKGVLDRFLACRTLTRARQVLFGVKRGGRPLRSL
ncbi:MAG: hypothetical protein ACYDH4_10160 [Candidatus Cryosericum sp.]